MPISLAPLKRRLRPTWNVLKHAADGYIRDNASLLGAGVAFWAVLSISPMLVLTLVITSFAYDAETVRAHVAHWLDENVGSRAAEWIVDLLETASAPGATTLPGLLSVVVMVWSATRMLHALQVALNQIWSIRSKGRHGIGRRVLHLVRKRALTFLLLVLLGLLLILSLAVGTAMPLLTRLLSDLPGWWLLYRAIEMTISTVAICLITALVYMILPDVRVPWRLVWRGALTTGVMMLVGKLVFGWYLGRASLGTYGAAGSIVALLLWIYLSVQVFLFGAEVTQAYARVVGFPKQPEREFEEAEEEAAVPRT